MKIKRSLLCYAVVFTTVFLSLFFAACTENTKKGSRDNTSNVFTAEASGEDTNGNESVEIDCSHTDQGYVMVKYLGSNQKVRLQITDNSENVYTYILRTDGNYEVFPFTSGDGTYVLNLYENISGDQYVQAYSTTIEVALENEFLPFLYANQYVNFKADSEAVALGEKLAKPANTDIDVVEAVYEYIIDNITYDYDLAASVSTGYLPNVDEVFRRKKGICFDYAALTAVILRSQGIPTKLIVGYADDDSHAWISVYIDGIGWVNGAIEFKGTDWVRMDPTFDANHSSMDQFIGNGSDYHPLYYY